LLLLCGCAAPQAARLREAVPPGLPERAALADVPFFPQRDYYCGPAALAMTLSASGVRVRPEDLVPLVYLPERQGSLQVEMVGAVRHYARLPYIVEPTLRALLAEVAAGHPVVVLQNLGLSWLPKWHYAVVVGYDLDDSTIVLHSGTAKRQEMPLSTFEHTWGRGGSWAMLVLRPGQWPAEAAEKLYLDQVMALEQVGQVRAAAAAYRAATRRWPRNLVAWMGLGNSLYAQRRLAGAEKAFRRATAVDPKSGAAFNNLAQTLAERRCYVQARAAARRAIKLGSPWGDQARSTLREIARMEKHNRGRHACRP
jgi:Peptidase_C39 like family/Tetratricopeptide repeat